MKPTKFINLLAWFVPAITAGYITAEILVGTGSSIPVATIDIIVTLPLIAAAEVLAAIPLFKYRKSLNDKKVAPRVNPFYAVRVLLMAKAILLAGTIFAGWHIGLAWAQFTSPVVTEAIWSNLGGFVGGFLMAVAGYVVERFCRIPEDDSSDPAAA